MNWDATWLGVGVKSGGQLFFGGLETISGVFINLGNISERHEFVIDNRRLGMGLGGSAGITVVLVFNLRGIYWLDGRDLTGFSINLAWGDKLGNVGQYLNDIGFFRAVSLIARDATGPANWLPVLQGGSQAVGDAIDAQSNRDHLVTTFDVPYGGIGMEFSIVDTSGKIWIDPDAPLPD